MYLQYVFETILTVVNAILILSRIYKEEFYSEPEFSVPLISRKLRKHACKKK